jgi:hypothetical protein
LNTYGSSPNANKLQKNINISDYRFSGLAVGIDSLSVTLKVQKDNLRDSPWFDAAQGCVWLIVSAGGGV